jgi:hypothetical protein
MSLKMLVTEFVTHVLPHDLPGEQPHYRHIRPHLQDAVDRRPIEDITIAPGNQCGPVRGNMDQIYWRRTHLVRLALQLYFRASSLPDSPLSTSFVSLFGLCVD